MFFISLDLYIQYSSIFHCIYSYACIIWKKCNFLLIYHYIFTGHINFFFSLTLLILESISRQPFLSPSSSLDIRNQYSYLFRQHQSETTTSNWGGLSILSLCEQGVFWDSAFFVGWIVPGLNKLEKTNKKYIYICLGTLVSGELSEK